MTGRKTKGAGIFAFTLRKIVLYYLCERRGAANEPQDKEIGTHEGSA